MGEVEDLVKKRQFLAQFFPARDFCYFSSRKSREPLLLTYQPTTERPSPQPNPGPWSHSQRFRTSEELDALRRQIVALFESPLPLGNECEQASIRTPLADCTKVYPVQLESIRNQNRARVRGYRLYVIPNNFERVRNWTQLFHALTFIQYRSKPAFFSIMS
jgi:hypothetical protein